MLHIYIYIQYHQMIEHISGYKILNVRYGKYIRVETEDKEFINMQDACVQGHQLRPCPPDTRSYQPSTRGHKSTDCCHSDLQEEVGQYQRHIHLRHVHHPRRVPQEVVPLQGRQEGPPRISHKVAGRRQKRHLQAPAAYQAGVGTTTYVICFVLCNKLCSSHQKHKSYTSTLSFSSTRQPSSCSCASSAGTSPPCCSSPVRLNEFFNLSHPVLFGSGSFFIASSAVVMCCLIVDHA
jgi:hypothetical protein